MQASLANGPTKPTDWQTVNWRQVNRRVRNLRRRIFRASQQGDHKMVSRLQKLMLHSYSNRLHAVRRVTQLNDGKDVTLCLIMHHVFTAKMHQRSSAKMHQQFAAKVHHPAG